MGGIINPISYRLGWSRYWSSFWGLSHNNRSKMTYLNQQDIMLRKYFTKLMQLCTQPYILLSFLKIIRNPKNFIVFFHYNCPLLEWTMDEWDFLNFSKKKQTISEIKDNEPQVYIFKPWRPEFNENEDTIWLTFLKKSVYPILKKSHLTTHEFRSLFLISLKQAFIDNLFLPFFALVRPGLNKHFRLPFIFITSRWTIPQMTAQNLTQFMHDKFETYSTLKQVLRSARYVIRLLLKEETIKGFKVMYCGRFRRLGRRGRATYSWEKDGPLPLSTVVAPISYSSMRIRLKYSTCGFKVWLLHK